MTVQNKRIPNDLGSAVVEEVVGQLNSAVAYMRMADIAHGGAAAEERTIVGIFAQDVQILDISFTVDAPVDQAGDIIEVMTGVNADNSDGNGEIRFSGTDFTAPLTVAGANTTSLHTLTEASNLAATVVGGMPFNVDAGEAVGLNITLAAATNIENITVHYRPVQDALTLRPSTPNKMRNWSVTNR